MIRRSHRQPVAVVAVVTVVAAVAAAAAVMAMMNSHHCRESLPLAESPESVEHPPHLQWAGYSGSPSVDIDGRACHRRSGGDSRHSPRRPATRGLARYYPRYTVASCRRTLCGGHEELNGGTIGHCVLRTSVC